MFACSSHRGGHGAILADLSQPKLFFFVVAYRYIPDLYQYNSIHTVGLFKEYQECHGPKFLSGNRSISRGHRQIDEPIELSGS